MLKKIIITMFILSISFSLFAFKYKKNKIDLRGSSSENFSSRGAKLIISADKNRYHISDKIIIKLKIKNTGFYPFSFYLNKNYLLNFTLIAREPSGKIAQMKDIQYYKYYKEYRDSFYKSYTGSNFHSRVIVLQPNEEFVRSIQLKDIIVLNNEKSNLLKYTITAYFYPNPEQNSKLFLKSSNQYTVFIDFKEEKQSSRDEFVLQEETGLSPKEVMYLFLSAEYTKTWKNFFKYVSLRDFIVDYPVFARKYIRAGINKKNQILQDFRKYLMRRKTHKLISFEILSEENKSNINRKLYPQKMKSLIKAKAVRIIDGFKREFYYTYYLTKINSTWKITGSRAQLVR